MRLGSARCLEAGRLTPPEPAGTVYRELRQSLIDMDTLFNLQSVGLAIKVRAALLKTLCALC